MQRGVRRKPGEFEDRHEILKACRVELTGLLGADESTGRAFAFVSVLPLVPGVVRVVCSNDIRLAWDLLLTFCMSVARTRARVRGRGVTTVLFARMRVMKAATKSCMQYH